MADGQKVKKAKAGVKAAKLYRCRVLCFSGEKLWKPGEKQYSARPLDDLHWECLDESANQSS